MLAVFAREVRSEQASCAARPKLAILNPNDRPRRHAHCFKPGSTSVKGVPHEYETPEPLRGRCGGGTRRL
jgi:hypothetical protein